MPYYKGDAPDVCSVFGNSFQFYNYILQGINMFTPEEGDPAYKVKANEKYGTQWGVDMAYGLWNTEKVSDLSLIHI